ncbi:MULTISPECIES: cobaltochelatase subunit CobT [Sphingobium]|jgi:cobaltochelatase CobT|uniref:Cobaltochelatase subunit CobT n=2 Tax=Sphingobium fuliginis (strain ATCC 27551) TaxID=336203 RepID=A0A7M2GGD3_SPHSA|nr:MULTISPECIES: cobaltochelatase subunit CobT [Sphingobium]OAP29224.1 cobaltochelatase subunit CobT [Sphingobium sp. 20006FA]KXU29233.1 cobaltochelatase subunit CobT [Sphingobium sp. AM]KYC29679.1 cobaltochelatase subunit CobT [Sphingobium sp. 22B]QDC38525.1 cobaltochelatase subunit CobT [Sphingobium fuliginis ATCC 27551]QOT71079.1 cobaltochelatase subunit CobT [Sphingobium fuliginis]
MADRSPLDAFKDVLSGAARSIARDAEVEVSFTADTPHMAGKAIKVPTPGRNLPADQVALARGFADANALRLRHHNARIHNAAAPADATARAVYDAVEQARVEAIGSRAMEGVRANLNHALDLKLKSDPIRRARSADEVPLSTALALKVRERLTGQAAPKDVRAGLAMVDQWIEDKAGADLDALAMAIDDQRAFQKLTSAMLEHLQLIDADVPPETDESEPQEEGEDEEQQQEDGDSGEDQAGDSDAFAEARAEDQGGDTEDGETEYSDEFDADSEEGAEDMGEEGMMPVRPNRPMGDLPPGFDYKPYTQLHDEVVTAEDLCDEDELLRLRGFLDQQLVSLQGAVTKLANRLQRRLMAQQSRSWDFDQEEGLLDAARLARIVIDPTRSLSYKIERDTEFRDTVVTLLIDNSGSMRGRPISIAAISADIMARTLERCGVKTEILGFTTRAWKGGQSREDWLAAGRPPMPGRLNDLRHIIYKKADEPWRRARKNLGLMMREGLLKENIDGEALLWAHNRLIARNEERRILMVISDGAPVDDSTLSVNSGTYLERHLRQVIEWIENRSPVQLVAIGIGHDVTRYYRRAVTIMDAEQLGGTMVEQLAGLFDED